MWVRFQQRPQWESPPKCHSAIPKTKWTHSQGGRLGWGRQEVAPCQISRDRPRGTGEKLDFFHFLKGLCMTPVGGKRIKKSTLKSARDFPAGSRDPLDVKLTLIWCSMRRRDCRTQIGKGLIKAAITPRPKAFCFGAAALSGPAGDRISGPEQPSSSCPPDSSTLAGGRDVWARVCRPSYTLAKIL